MPHSSGGGSHGGGTHSSGGGSSYRSSSSSSSSYSDSYTPSARISDTYFSGATRYVYYDRGGTSHSFYSDSEPSKPDLMVTIIAVVIMTGIAGLILWFLLAAGLYTPSKLDVSSYQAGPVIEDHLDLIESNHELWDAMQTFQDETGVSAAVELVKESEWMDYYTSLETFAYSEYLRQFDDEKHWLMVISYPDDYSTVNFIDWQWEGMIGDDCYRAIDSESEEKLTTVMQKHLLRAKPEQLSDQLAQGFLEFSETAMERQVSVFFLVLAFIIFVIYALLSGYYIKDYITTRKQYNATPVAVNAVEKMCEYCGRPYVSGSISICPSCGAPVSVSTASSSKKSKKARKS